MNIVDDSTKEGIVIADMMSTLLARLAFTDAASLHAALDQFERRAANKMPTRDHADDVYATSLMIAIVRHYLAAEEEALARMRDAPQG